MPAVGDARRMGAWYRSRVLTAVRQVGSSTVMLELV
jgi:hypothetical protein